MITRARVIYSSDFYLGVFILPCILIFDYLFRGTTKNTTSAANQEPVALALERRISGSVEFFLAWTKPPMEPAENGVDCTSRLLEVKTRESTVRMFYTSASKLTGLRKENNKFAYVKTKLGITLLLGQWLLIFTRQKQMALA